MISPNLRKLTYHLLPYSKRLCSLIEIRKVIVLVLGLFIVKLEVKPLTYFFILGKPEKFFFSGPATKAEPTSTLLRL